MTGYPFLFLLFSFFFFFCWGTMNSFEPLRELGVSEMMGATWNTRWGYNGLFCAGWGDIKLRPSFV